MSQCAYIDSIIDIFRFTDTKPLFMPMDPNVILSKDQSPTTPDDIALMASKPYAEALGALQYTLTATQLDITFACRQLTQFTQNPRITHWTALKCVYQYLKATRDLWLVLGHDTSDILIGYSDSDGSSTKECKPISGYIFLLHGSTIFWSSKRQLIITLLTTESEYVALTHTMKEAIWLQSLYQEIFGTPLDIPLRSDNQGAIALAKDD
ncbi:hypothetical protein AX16_009098 [Volvariella volvacea WC 439]|nr:hypothetical protein AX16_009098 [Volvariella volvacea WC 439]